MKKVCALLIVMSFILTGCKSDSESIKKSESDTSNDINIIEKTEDEVVVIDGGEIESPDGPVFVDDGTCSGHGYYGIRYEKFEEMLNCEHCVFVEGKVVSRSDYSMFVDKIYVEVFKTESEDDSEIINISIGCNERYIYVGQNYIFNLLYNLEYDYYSLSQGPDSVFNIRNGFITSPDRFSDEDLPTDADEFRNYISID